jgi:6-phosphofructokinase 1
MEKTLLDFRISHLGQAGVDSPLALSTEMDDMIVNYVSDQQRLMYKINVEGDSDKEVRFDETNLLELAGPREKIYFDPAKVRAAVVTCGGLCPGLNNVIRSLVMCLWYRYGVRRITGIKYGYRGFLPEFSFPYMDLEPAHVEEIHRDGGTILGSSRGYGERTSDIVDALERMNINALFVIGGDGAQKGALSIAEELQRRKQKIAVVGIPKTIDNDLSFVQKSFGFETAVSHAAQAVASAHIEAHDAVNGIGIVKVMGRESGFIAAHTALATTEVNVVLIPEIPFDLEGRAGLLAFLEKRLESRHHAVVVVAEGAGQSYIAQTGEVDASGNRKLADIGLFLKDKIDRHFQKMGIEINLRYIDPSYTIRSAPANPNDSLYCARLGTHAVHAAMAGKSAMLVSLVHNQFVHVPMSLAVSRPNRVDPEGGLWRDVVEATGQPLLLREP